ncbi:hypothetical protein MtrunA17_Chr6g0485201 [Medicago truncatula]|uniref:Uncharacterized protein n=1 Tax=Medicago truncatula TaxID=3880 RepID=A0A396HPS3_MEDTR|nr:hypothetical protein MtrunA17_Chr6g0485201 [Medicago truncatula]
MYLFEVIFFKGLNGRVYIFQQLAVIFLSCPSTHMRADKLNSIGNNLQGPFDGQDREAEYDTLIVFCLNRMFDAPKDMIK